MHARFYVRDSRNGNMQGPFTRPEAQQLANDLNDFVRRNAGITSRPFTFGTKETFEGGR